MPNGTPGEMTLSGSSAALERRGVDGLGSRRCGDRVRLVVVGEHESAGGPRVELEQYRRPRCSDVDAAVVRRLEIFDGRNPVERRGSDLGQLDDLVAAGSGGEQLGEEAGLVERPEKILD